MFLHLHRNQTMPILIILKVVQGAVIQSLTIELKIRLDEEKESILGFAITEIRQRFSSDSPEIILPFKPDLLD